MVESMSVVEVDRHRNTRATLADLVGLSSAGPSSNNNTTDTERVVALAESETEELLRGAFDELEKERAKRIELEAKLRALEENTPSSTTAPQEKIVKRKSKRRSSKLSSASISAKQEDASSSTTAATISPKDYTALQQELEGYRQIVNAMTQEKPAIAAAIQANEARKSAVNTGRPPLQNPTLPLHVIHLLEVMPWEPKAQEHVFGTEEIYEWQVYDIKKQNWCTSLNQLPSFFQALPALEATTNAVQESKPSEMLRQPGRDRSMLMFLAGVANMGNGSGTSASLTAPPDDSVLTNSGLSHVVRLANGFPLPHDGGTWQWVGGWRIEKRVIVFAGDGVDNRPRTLDTDEDGWCYAMDASDYLKDNPEDYCFERPGMVEDKLTLEKSSFLSGNKVVRHLVPIRKVRRRKWTRRRVLVDYPFASEQSKHFLSLLAQNASLTVAANKISDQLVETKMKLTDTQLKTVQNEEETKTKVAQLEQEIRAKELDIQSLKLQKITKKKSSGSKKSTNSSQTNTTKAKSTESDAPKTSPQDDEEEPKKLEKENPTEEEEEETPKKTPQQGSDLQSMLSQWISPNNKLKLIKNDEAEDCSETENPVSGDASETSATVSREEDDSSLEPQQQAHDDSEASETEHADDSVASCSRRNSASSTGSQIAFDWKKLGRDTMEKLKQGQVAAANAPLLWRGHKDKGSSTPRSTSPTEESSETSIEEDQDVVEPAGAWVQESPSPTTQEMTAGA